MRFCIASALFSLVLAGCQDRTNNTAAPPGSPASPPGLAKTGEPSAPASPVSGTISGKAFVPDQATLAGRSLTFRKGKDFFPEMEIRFDLPDPASSNLAGKDWTFSGDDFKNPTIWVAATEGKGVPKTEFVFPKDYSMTLKITKQTPRTVEGVIDLKVTNPANTKLAGTFQATVKKTLDDPLDAEDVPYVHGRIVFVGPWKDEKISAGFFGKGADGKQYSNSAGTTLSPGGGGGAMNLSFEPQLTGITNSEKDGPGFRHTKMRPGEYVVYVRRNEVIAAWQKVTVKPEDKTKIDLTIDPSKMGEVVVTLPDSEANDSQEWHLSLIPLELSASDSGYNYAFNVAQTKKGQKVIPVKGVPAGTYRVMRGKSEGTVEVTAGKSAAVTLERNESKKK